MAEWKTLPDEIDELQKALRTKSPRASARVARRFIAEEQNKGRLFAEDWEFQFATHTTVSPIFPGFPLTQGARRESLAELATRIVWLAKKPTPSYRTLAIQCCEHSLRLMGVDIVSGPRADRIAPDDRTIPMTMKRAAKLMGYAENRGEKDAVELLSKSIRDGSVAAERQSRQRYVFDRRDFPKETHGKITPKCDATHPNLP